MKSKRAAVFWFQGGNKSKELYRYLENFIFTNICGARLLPREWLLRGAMKSKTGRCYLPSYQIERDLIFMCTCRIVLT